MRRAIFVQHRLAGGPIATGHPQFDQAHSAIPRYGELRVVAIVRYFFSDHRRGFDHISARWHL